MNLSKLAISALKFEQYTGAVCCSRLRYGPAFYTQTRGTKNHFVQISRIQRSNNRVLAELMPRPHHKPPFRSGIHYPETKPNRPPLISCTPEIFEPYVPPEGDGKASMLSTAGVKQQAERAKSVATTQNSLRKIKKMDVNFQRGAFTLDALDRYKQVHHLLCEYDEESLHNYVTERIFHEIVFPFQFKTLRWSYVESLEPAQVVHARVQDMLSKSNLYAQITLRIHSKQTLAIYDRFGRLMAGHQDVPKDVLEYVVFEKHLNDPYGEWRVHGKIIPDWAPPRERLLKTELISGHKIERASEEPFSVFTGKMSKSWGKGGGMRNYLKAMEKAKEESGEAETKG